MTQRKASGQTLSEYGIIGVLLALIAVVPLTMLGGNIGQLFEGLMPKRASLPVPQVAGTPSAAGNLLGGASNGSTAGTGTLKITLTSGKEITLENYPTDLPKSIETAGTNGTTRLMADSMKALVDELLAAGEISPQEAQKLTVLANAGHALAEAQRQVEDGYASAGWDFGQTDTVAVTVGGKNFPSLTQAADDLFVLYTADDDAGMWAAIESGDYAGAMQAVSDSYTSWNGAGKLMTPFMAAYKDALDSGALSNPAANQVVSELSAKILMMSQSMGWAQLEVAELAEAGTKPSNELLTGNILSYMPNNMEVSTQTHVNSGGICTTGNGTDSGVHCQ